MNSFFILEEFDETKIYGNKEAVKELENMNKISINRKPSSWYDQTNSITRISVLNCGSLRHQHEHINSDTTLTISDVICITETWLWENEDKTKFHIDGYKANHNCSGRGRGVSVYYKEFEFTHIEDIITDKIQLTKLSGTNIDVIAVYKSPTGNDVELETHIRNIINKEKHTLVCGDFNVCFKQHKHSKLFLTKNNFVQLVKEATHIDGGHIDHAYIGRD